MAVEFPSDSPKSPVTSSHEENLSHSKGNPIEDRIEELGMLSLAWKKVKGELGLFKRLLRKITFQSERTEIYQKVLGQIEKTVAKKISSPISEAETIQVSQVKTFIRSQLAKENPDFSSKSFTEDDVKMYIKILQHVQLKENRPGLTKKHPEKALLPDPVFDAAIRKLKTEQNGVLVGPELDTTKTYLGYPLFYVQNFVSDAIKGQVTWPILKPANISILKPLWRAIAEKVGVPKNGWSTQDIMSMHIQGMKALKQKFSFLDALFKAPYQTTDPLLNELLAERNITPEKLADFKENRFMDREKATFSNALKGVLTDYFQKTTGELIHPEGDNFESLHTFVKMLENHFIMLEDSAKVSLQDDALFEQKFSHSLEGKLCFNAKDRSLQNFYREDIVPKLKDNLETLTSENALRQQLGHYLEKEGNGKTNFICSLSPAAIKGMVEAGDLTYGIAFRSLRTTDASSMDFEQAFNAVVEEFIRKGRIVKPENEDWKTASKTLSPFEQYVNEKLEQAKGNPPAAVREMLQEYSLMEKEAILYQLLQKAMMDENGDLQSLHAADFREILATGTLTYGIPLQEILAVGQEKISEKDINAFIEDQIENALLEE